MRIALLALQGDFEEHAAVFRRLGCQTLFLRQARHLLEPFDGIILPGGESTVQGKLLRELNMMEPLRKMILDGKPVMATCAGTILLAKQLLDDPTRHLATLDIAVRRNAYGRQLSSFHIRGTFDDISNVPMSFIRAPQIEFCAPNTQVIAEHHGRITAVRHANQLAMTFHPELDGNTQIAEYFIEKICSR